MKDPLAGGVESGAASLELEFDLRPLWLAAARILLWLCRTIALISWTWEALCQPDDRYTQGQSCGSRTVQNRCRDRARLQMHSSDRAMAFPYLRVPVGSAKFIQTFQCVCCSSYHLASRWTRQWQASRSLRCTPSTARGRRYLWTINTRATVSAACLFTPLVRM